MVSRRVTLAIAIIISLVALHSQASPTDINGRILGGGDPETAQFPYVASVRKDNVHTCGGTIISQQHILTAAHCLYEDNQRLPERRVSVRVGTTNTMSGGKSFGVSEITVHPEYKNLDNDIAILRLERPVDFTERIAKIDLAEFLPPVDGSLTIAGWGDQGTGSASIKLKHITLPRASESACVDAYPDTTNYLFCVAHKLGEGSCIGDAGNGAVFNGKLAGVSTFIVGACGVRYPDFYASVPDYAFWINSVINK